MTTPATHPVARPHHRDEHGRAHVWVAVLVVLLLGGLGGVALTRETPDGRAAPTPATPLAATGCRPGPERAAPTIDLSVQPATRTALLSQARVDRLVDLAQTAGATVISTSTSWRYLQPSADTAPADFRFEGLDRVVAAARSRGLQVRLQLIGMPRWAVDPTAAADHPWSPTRAPLSDTELARWRTFVGVLAQHVAGEVDYLEVWNEPNGTAYWPTGPDPAAFARLLAATYEPAKAAAPDLQVVSGGLAGNDTGYLRTLYRAVADLGLPRVPFDLVGVHPFTGSAAPDEVDPARVYDRAPFGTYDENFTGFRQLHEAVLAAGDDADVYLTSFGYGTRGKDAVPDAVRAGYAVQALEAVTCSPYVRALSWYYLHPTPWDPAAWTLLDTRLRPNQTYRAFADWAAQVAPDAAASGSPEPLASSTPTA